MTKSVVWLLTVTHALSIKIDGDEIEEGQGATLRCQPSSDAMNVYWSFSNPIGETQVTIFAMDGQSTGVKPEYQSKWTNQPGTYDIHIDTALRNDNGTYTCMVTFPGSEVRMMTTDLIVKVPPSQPKITSPKDHKLIMNEPGKLQCYSVDGIPKPQYSWEKCNDPNSGSCKEMPAAAQTNTRVWGNSTFQLVGDPDTGDKIVQFHEVREIDEGFYRCRASNLAGSVYSEIVQIETASVSAASVVGIVFGVIFGVAALLVIGIMVIKRIRDGDDDGDDYDDGDDGANDVMIGDQYDDPYSRHNSSNNRHEHSMVV